MDSRYIFNQLTPGPGYPNETPSQSMGMAESPPHLAFLAIRSSANLQTAFQEVGPRRYQIKPSKKRADKARCFYVLGCGGNGGAAQIETAKLMDDTLSQEEDEPAFAIIVGDNVYDYGASRPDDPGFDTCFHQVYGNPAFTALSRLRFYLALGNHDANRHAKWFLSNNPVGEETEKNEIIHSYLDDPDAKRALYSQTTPNLKKLPRYNMPYFFYSVEYEGVLICIINSNSIAKDFLSWKKNSINPTKPNQFEWLKGEYDYAMQSGFKIIFAQHHPRYTAGKRAIPSKFDSQHYLSETEIQEINDILGTSTRSYNELIRRIYEHEQLYTDMDMVAHDHFNSYYNERDYTHDRKKICQLTSGGGGGELQERVSFKGHPYLAYHLKQNGFSKITFHGTRPETLFIDTYTTEGHHLRYTDQSRVPLCEISSNLQLEALRAQCLKIANHYLFDLKNEEETSNLTLETPPQPQKRGLLPTLFGSAIGIGTTLFHHAHSFWTYDKNRANEVICVHDLIAYFSQPTLTTLDDAIEKIKKYCEKLNFVGSNDLLSLKIETLLNTDYGVSIRPIIFNAASPSLRTASPTI